MCHKTTTVQSNAIKSHSSNSTITTFMTLTFWWHSWKLYVYWRQENSRMAFDCTVASNKVVTEYKYQPSEDLLQIHNSWDLWFYLSSQLMKIGLIDVHHPASVQKETTFVPPGQRRWGVNCGFGQQVNRLANQSPGRVPTRPPHNSVQIYVSCKKNREYWVRDNNFENFTE